MSDSMLPAAPFARGEKRWRVCSVSERVRIPCPVCNGLKQVTIILGDATMETVQCDACGLGFEGPRGYVEEWTQEPRVEPLVITDIVSWRDNEWRVRCSDGNEYDLGRLYVSELQAMEQAQAQAEALRENNYGARARRRKGVSKLTWSLYYHKQQIAECERKIAWHRAKISAQKGE